MTKKEKSIEDEKWECEYLRNAKEQGNIAPFSILEFYRTIDDNYEEHVWNNFISKKMVNMTCWPKDTLGEIKSRLENEIDNLVNDVIGETFNPLYKKAEDYFIELFQDSLTDQKEKLRKYDKLGNLSKIEECLDDINPYVLFNHPSGTTVKVQYVNIPYYIDPDDNDLIIMLTKNNIYRTPDVFEDKWYNNAAIFDAGNKSKYYLIDTNSDNHYIIEDFEKTFYPDETFKMDDYCSELNKDIGDCQEIIKKLSKYKDIIDKFSKLQSIMNYGTDMADLVYDDRITEIKNTIGNLYVDEKMQQLQQRAEEMIQLIINGNDSDSIDSNSD